MAVSRRTLLGSAAAVAALGGLPAVAYAAKADQDPDPAPNRAPVGAASTSARASSAGSKPGDVVGKVTVGYQGWFSCKGDGSPMDSWWHWAKDAGQAPSPDNSGVISWPDMADYDKGFETGFGKLGSGKPATLFSSCREQTVRTHFGWMKQYGIDTAALQRFDPTGGEGPARDAVAKLVRAAAEAEERKFYVMYDVSGWTGMRSQITSDWTDKMSALTGSPAYARQNGKPVVGIWGFGFSDDKRDFSPADCLEVVNWFKDKGCYVMGGVPTHWREGKNDSRAGFGDVYHAFDMISPWMVGRISTAAQSDSFHEDLNVPDQKDCDAHGIDYQPCVMPGTLQNGDRKHGDFMWRQFYNMVRTGAQGLYISMFDEYNEGNQIAKTAQSSADAPAGGGFHTLDEDGTACSSDYYLRLTGDGGKMLKGELKLTADRPTEPREPAKRE